MEIGAILLRCGDSRNGAAEKALKQLFGWPAEVRVKTVAVAGGAHASEIGHEFVLRQVEIYTSVLLKNGATQVVVVVTDHDDCGYVKALGRKEIGKYWTDPPFIRKVFGLASEIQKVLVATIGYESCDVPIVPSAEVTISIIASVTRE